MPDACVLAAGLEPAQSGLKVPGPSRRAPPANGSARPVSNESLSGSRAAPSPADFGPLGDGGLRVFSGTRPPACRAGALPLSYVSLVVMGGFDPPPRVLQTRALPTELHDHGAGPGTRTRISWVTTPVPVPPGPAGTPETPCHAASSGVSFSSDGGRTRSSGDGASGLAKRISARSTGVDSSSTGGTS